MNNSHQLIRLIYTSSATNDMSEEQLFELLIQSRSRNKKQNVTGMLVYRNGAFLQVLEGEPKDVDEIYKAIMTDPRNSGHYLLDRGSIPERRFPNWTMGFKNLSQHQPEELDGYSDILEGGQLPEEIRQHRDIFLALLQKF